MFAISSVDKRDDVEAVEALEVFTDPVLLDFFFFKSAILDKDYLMHQNCT